jgi:hypothetical protein
MTELYDISTVEEARQTHSGMSASDHLRENVRVASADFVGVVQVSVSGPDDL